MTQKQDDQREKGGQLLLGAADLLELFAKKLRQLGTELVGRPKNDNPRDKR